MRSEVTVGLRKNKQEQELMKRRNVGDVVNGKLYLIMKQSSFK